MVSTTSTVSTPLSLDLNEIITSLSSLSSQLISHRTSSDSFDPNHYLTQAAPSFAALHTLNRHSLQFTKQSKLKTQDSRLQMDASHLTLQNLMFEKNHLEREIRKCEEFESSYQNLPLHSLTSFHSLHPQPPSDPHELMLARLSFELEERQRLDEEKKNLGLRKAALVKENERKKARLVELEKQLDDFVASAKSIQEKMHVDV